MGVFCHQKQQRVPPLLLIGENQQHCKQQLMSKYEMSEEETYMDTPVSTKVYLPERESHRLIREDFLRGRQLACSSHQPFSFPEHRNGGFLQC